MTPICGHFSPLFEEHYGNFSQLYISENAVELSSSSSQYLYSPSILYRPRWRESLHYIGAASTLSLIICVLIYYFTLFRFLSEKGVLRVRDGRLRLPALPYAVPLLYNALELAWSPARFLEYITSSKALTSKPGTIFALSRILNTPKKVIPFYAADYSGMAAKPRKESTVRHEDRIHYWQAHTNQKWLSGASIRLMSENYLRFLNDELARSISGNDWVDVPDLYRFLQIHVSTAAIKAMMGTEIFKQYQTLVEDFWEFDRKEIGADWLEVIFIGACHYAL
ncbi:hypothetical protein K458DRAFT_391073 [Lentithecium fluviatile CBS 122367]|uniref:Cytochrome P450 n=1 Tax=Lentithecium fluviatile CBS 122367 TaxID=1168545 RepID=A0A6G1IUW1_9PLEO|nr:hypothetical protein K458DRAFT_391073 [Lentithecium fluviatile CBS 122367]